MADMSFDVVYCGGGYGALMSAPYFAMNDMSVGIFEALPELGGGHGVGGPKVDARRKRVGGFDIDGARGAAIDYLQGVVDELLGLDRGLVNLQGGLEPWAVHGKCVGIAGLGGHGLAIVFVVFHLEV